MNERWCDVCIHELQMVLTHVSHSLISSHFSVESCYVGLWSGTNNKNKEDKRMSNNLDTNNNLSDIAKGFQNNWP
jgi:hypothetical protein